MESLIIGSLSAIAIGIATEAATGAISGAVRELRRAANRRKRFEFDVREDGLFPLGEWSPARQLEPHRLLTDTLPMSERPEQEWINPTVLAAAVAECAEQSSGEILYFAGFRLDYRESDDTQYCKVRQAESRYPEVLAVERLRIRRPELFKACDEAIERDIKQYLFSPVPSSVAVNLVVVSSDGSELLSVERSAATDSAAGWWTVGVFETMKRSDPNRPGSPESLYGLAARGLNEELGLNQNDYGKIVISWVGLLRPILRGHVVAIVQLKISREDAFARLRAAHSSYEHSAIDWLPLHPRIVRSFIRANRQTNPGRVGSTIRINQRIWIEQSRLAVLEAWRFRMALND